MRKIILILLFVVSLLAEDWVPYVNAVQGKIDSAALAPDGKFFFTLKDGLVTHWKLNPIKRIDSFMTEAKQIRKDWQYIYQIYIDDNASKMVINSPLEIQVWDLKNRKIIVKKEVKTNYGVMLNSDFYTISKDRSLIQWSLKNLEIQRQKKFPNLCIGREKVTCRNEPYVMFGDGDTLAIASSNFISLVDAKTFNSIKNLYKDSHARIISLSLDNKYLYFIDKGSPASLTAEERPPVVRLEISTGSTKLVSPFYVHSKTITNQLMESVSQYDSGMPQRRSKGLSIANNLVLAKTRFELIPVLGTPRGFGFFNVQSKEVLGKFFQFEDGEWILMDKKGYFEASSNAKKYLYMKHQKYFEDKNVSSDKYPINDAIYTKYNKSIIIKAN